MKVAPVSDAHDSSVSLPQQDNTAPSKEKSSGFSLDVSSGLGLGLFTQKLNGGSGLFGISLGAKKKQAASETEKVNDIPKRLQANPFVTVVTDDYPQFDRMQPEHILPALKYHIKTAESDLKALAKTAEPTWEGVMVPLMEIEYPIMRFWSLVGHLEEHKINEAWTPVITEAKEKLVELSLKIKQNKAIFNAMLKIKEDPQKWEALDKAQQRVLASNIQSGELGGIKLEGKELRRFNKIESELTVLHSKFSENRAGHEKHFEIVITDPTELAGVTEKFRTSAAEAYNKKHPDADEEATPESGPYSINSTYSNYKSIMTTCDHRATREKVYRSYVSKASSGEYNNTPVVKRILQLRQEQAQLLGFNNYAELSISVRMAPSPEKVMELENEILKFAKPKAEAEMKELQAYAKSLGFEEDFQWWDYEFYSEKLKEEKFGFTNEATRDYFPFPKVLEGMFGLYEQLFGITIKESDKAPATWTEEEVWFYEVFDNESGDLLGEVFYDPYGREGKYDHAWYLDLRNRRVTPDGEVELPLVTLNTSYEKPAEGEVPRITLSQVNTLFHEFGHCLQGVLTTQDLEQVAGTNGIERDGVEVASQALEYFLKQKELVLAMSEHKDTGETMPEEMFDQILAAGTYMSGNATVRQLSFGLADQKLHSEYDPNQDEISPHDVFREVSNDVSAMDSLPEDTKLNTFSHLFGGDYNGYAAGYYGYMWADVISADYFTRFEPHLDDPDMISELGSEFRDTLFATGGGEDPNEVFFQFMERYPTVDALMRYKGFKETE